MMATLQRVTAALVALGAMPADAGAQGLAYRPVAAESPAAAGAVSDLATAMQMAMRKPELLAAQARERAGVARVDQAQAAYGPTLDAEASYGYAEDRFERRSEPALTLSGFTATARAVLSQQLFTSGRLTADRHEAEADRELQHQGRRLAESQSLLRGIEAYIGLERDLALLRIARESRDLLERQAQSSAERFDKHDLTAVDNDQVRARLETTRAELARAEAVTSIARARFIEAVGAPPGDLAPTPLEIALMPPTLDEAEAIAAAKSPLLLAAHARERISRAQLGGARAELGPLVTLEGSLERGAQSVYGNGLHQTVLRGAITARMPLLDGGRRYARIKEAGALNDSDWWLVDQARREVQLDVRTSWDRRAGGLRAIGSLRAAEQSARQAYGGAVLQERAGLVTTLDVLILLRDLLEIRSQLANAEAETRISGFELLAAMGILQADQLGIERAEMPGTRRVTDALTLPLGPTVKAADSLLSGSGGKARVSRDQASGGSVAGLTMPTEFDRPR